MDTRLIEKKPMPVSYFVDTNLLIYRYSRQDEEKRAISARMLATGHCVASVQVINEFCNVIRKKFPVQFLKIESTLLEIKSVLHLESLVLEDTLSAIRISQTHGFQYYDALILAAALRLGCQAVLSEDMQHGFVLDGRLTIVNPFILQ